MGDAGRDWLEWSNRENVPDGRCGFTTENLDLPWLPGNVTCWRKPWPSHERCIWHADVAFKPPEELADARTDSPERLDGAVLRDANIWVEIPFADCSLVGSDLRDANFVGVRLPGADIHRANCRGANFVETRLTAANLWRADLKNANFRNAILTDADLYGADLTDAHFYEAQLTNVDLRDVTIHDTDTVDLCGATVTGIGIDYTALDNLQIDEGTTFGGRSRWEADADEAATDAIPLPWQPSLLRCLGRPHTNSSALEQAQLQYRATQRILRENDYGELPELDVREKHARRKQVLAEWEPGELTEAPRQYVARMARWVSLAGARWVTKYGESPWRVVLTSLAVIAAGVVIYPYTGLDVPTWIDRAYFSVATFTPLMQAQGLPAPDTLGTKLVAMAQALLGVALTALLVAVLDRRITR